MLIEAAACCFGGAFVFYLWSSNDESRARTLNSATRVKELNGLEELLGDNNRPSRLVAVFGKVGSTEAFECNRSGDLCVSLTEKAKLVFKTENKAGDYSKKEDSEEIVLSHKSVPWFLEDESGRVNVVGFDATFKRNVFAEPANELFQRVLSRKGVKIIRHTCSEDVLEIGTPLTIVGKPSETEMVFPRS